MQWPLITLLLAIVSIQFGASIARSLFVSMGPLAMTTWRLSLASAIMLVLVRPPLRGYSKEQQLALAYYGLSLGLMNLCFYLALAKIPLGIAVALEFTGPILLALSLSRRLRDFLWVLLAALGILLINPLSSQSALAPQGVLLALVAGVFWALYILAGKKLASVMDLRQGAALGLLAAALVIAPIGLSTVGRNLWQPNLLWPLIGVAFFSSALPYPLEMISLKKLPAKTFSVLISLEPAFAALMGWAVLGEKLRFLEGLGIISIIAAALGSTLSTPQMNPPEKNS